MLCEQASIAAAMEQDFKKVQGLVDEALHAVSVHPGATSVGCVSSHLHVEIK